jgi:hypothetical protein
MITNYEIKGLPKIRHRGSRIKPLGPAPQRFRRPPMNFLRRTRQLIKNWNSGPPYLLPTPAAVQ